MDEITRRKISAALRGKEKSPEHRRKIGDQLRGRTREPRSEECKERIRRGNRATGRKANWEIVREIRLMRRLGHSVAEILARFPGLSRTAVYDIIAERTWPEQYRPSKPTQP